MSLQPIPGVVITQDNKLTAPWLAWFQQLSMQFSAGSGPVPQSRKINTIAPLQGGGDLSVDRTFSITLFDSTHSGIVPAPFGASTNFLRGDGTWASVGAIIGLRAAVALPAGASNNLSPGVTWPVNFNRLILTAPSGAANVTGLVAGTDGQQVFILNNDPTNAIILNNQNAGSAAANQFLYVADLDLPPGASVVAMYDGTLARWML